LSGKTEEPASCGRGWIFGQPDRMDMAQIEPINIASADFLRELDAIEPGVWGTPCAAFLVDGRAYEACLVWENRRYSDAGDWINPSSVALLRESPVRMPARFARVIHDAGESGMGYHLYTVEFRDGTSLVHVAGNLVIDLLNMPDGYTQRDIVNVRPHEGRERTFAGDWRQMTDYRSVEYARPR
jgi:hypothetical protein